MSEDENDDFAGMMPGVKRLKHDRINVYAERARKPPNPLRHSPAGYRHQSPATPEPTSTTATYFDAGLQKKLQHRIRQGLIRPEAVLDLHGYRSHEAVDALDAFIDGARDAGQRMLVVVHGRGYRSAGEAVLRPLVQRRLGERGDVLAWCPAQPRDGADGASYVYLRRCQATPPR